MAFESDFDVMFETYDSSTIREDLSDIIVIASPVDTPFLSMLPQIGVHSTTFDWALDHVTRPTIRKASPEGADIITTAALNSDIIDTRSRFRPVNTLQITRGFVDVSDSQRAMLQAGVDDEFSYQVWKIMLEVAEQAEFQLHWGKPRLGAQGGTAGGGGTPQTPQANPRETAGFMWWAHRLGKSDDVATNLSSETDIVGPNWNLNVVGENEEVYKPLWFDPGAPQNLTRPTFATEILRPAWQNGMTIAGSIWHMPSQIKRLFADFGLVTAGAGATASQQQLNERNIPAELKHLIDVTDIYESEFGKVFLNIDRYFDDDPSSGLLPFNFRTGGANTAENLSMARSLFGWQPGMLEIAVLRPAQFTLLAKIGDATKGMIVMEYGTKVLNPVCIVGATDVHI